MGDVSLHCALSTEGYATVLPSALRNCVELRSCLREKQGMQVTVRLGQDVHFEKNFSSSKETTAPSRNFKLI